MEALDILNDMRLKHTIYYVKGSEQVIIINEAIEELEKLIKDQSQDRLAELEKVILDYYLAKGHQVGIGGWGFKVNISTYHKEKEIQIMFKKDFHSNYETVFRVWQKTTKEIFNAAFEYFSIKD